MGPADGFHILREKWLAAFRNVFLKPNGVMLTDDVIDLCDRYDKLNISQDLSMQCKIAVHFHATITSNRFGPEKDGSTHCEKLEAWAWSYLKDPRWVQKTWEQYFDAIFQVLDSNQDGKISPTQFAYYYIIFGKSAKQAEDLFKLLDTNRDGQITRKEYVDAYCAYMCDPDISIDDLPLYDPICDVCSV